MTLNLLELNWNNLVLLTLTLTLTLHWYCMHISIKVYLVISNFTGQFWLIYEMCLFKGRNYMIVQNFNTPSLFGTILQIQWYPLLIVIGVELGVLFTTRVHSIVELGRHLCYCYQQFSIFLNYDFCCSSRVLWYIYIYLSTTFTSRT